MNKTQIEQYRFKIKKLKHKIQKQHKITQQLSTKSLKLSKIIQNTHQISNQTIMSKLYILLREKGLTLEDLFRCCDPQYKQFITLQSFTTLLKHLNIKLSKQQYDYIGIFLMPNQLLHEHQYKDLINHTK